MHMLSSNIPNMDIESDEDDESDVLEESPCGRYQKRREEVITILYSALYIYAYTLILFLKIIHLEKYYII